MRERDNKREHHKKGEAIGHFNALLTDLVRNADLTWKEVKRTLRKDHRFPMVEVALEREERERLFNEHVNMLEKKKRDKFREMLDEMPSLDFGSSWKEVKRQIRDDPRYMKYNSSEKVTGMDFCFLIVKIFLFLFYFFSVRTRIPRVPAGQDNGLKDGVPRVVARVQDDQPQESGGVARKHRTHA